VADAVRLFAAGHYRISVTNAPSPANPQTSHIVAWSVMGSLQSRALPTGVFP
jgi:predicted dinucleotide-utilizing enzyme